MAYNIERTPHEAMEIYLEDSYKEFQDELRQHGGPFPLEIVDRIIAQDAVAAIRIYLMKEKGLI